MKVLISPIGFSDPMSDKGEGPALTLCRYLHPDVVFLLPTAERVDVKGSTYERGEMTEKQLQEILPNSEIYIRSLDVNDPTDFSQIIHQLKSNINSILDQTQNYPQREFWVNVSSATSQIQAACLLAVGSGLLGLPPARALQVADPRYVPESERVREVPVALLQEKEQIDKVARLFQGYLFDACAEELQSLRYLTSSRQRRDAVESWRLLCQAYAALDRLDYETSYKAMSSLMEKIRGTSEYRSVTPLLEKQISTLERLRGSNAKENELILTDMYHNAQRRFNQGNFADTLARIWRVIEGGMFYYLRQNYGIEPTDLSQSPCLESSESTINLAADTVRKLMAEGKKYLSFESSRTTLQEDLYDEAFCDFLVEKVALRKEKKEQIGGLMEGVRQKRNSSVIAHGVKPVEEETAQTSLGLAEYFLHFLFPGLDLSLYPFSPGNLEQVKDSIKKII
jgi:hypothetical protein